MALRHQGNARNINNRCHKTGATKNMRLLTFKIVFFKHPIFSNNSNFTLYILGINHHHNKSEVLQLQAFCKHGPQIVFAREKQRKHKTVNHPEGYHLIIKRKKYIISCVMKSINL